MLYATFPSIACLVTTCYSNHLPKLELEPTMAASMWQRTRKDALKILVTSSKQILCVNKSNQTAFDLKTI